MDFALPEHLPGLLAEIDAFIEAEIKPLERENMQYFDQRRENARTDWDNGGIPKREWEDLLGEMRKRADKAGWLRYGLPSQFGGRDGTNIDMAVIREHLAHKGLGLHNDLQDESSIVGNFPQVIMMDRFGTEAQKAEWTDALITGERSMAFGLTEPNHGSDATWLETRAVHDGDGGGSRSFSHRCTPFRAAKTRAMALRRRFRRRLQFLFDLFQIGDHRLDRVVQLALAVHQVLDLVGALELRQLAIEQQPRCGQVLDVRLGVVAHLLELGERIGDMVGRRLLYGLSAFFFGFLCHGISSTKAGGAHGRPRRSNPS